MTRFLPRVNSMQRQAMTYLHLRANKLAAERAFNASARPLKKWLTENGEEDADGNLIFKFPFPISGEDGKDYAGVMLRRQQGPSTFDEDEVRAFAERKGFGYQARLIKLVEVVDLDELYVMQQEGKISEEELRGLMHAPDPTYALWPLEAAVQEEE